jgi:hypothetical protein
MTYSEREFGASQSDYPKEQKMSDITRALGSLLTNQRQLDADGVEVGVSRQALDEVLADYERLRAGRAAVVEECAKVADIQAAGADRAASLIPEGRPQRREALIEVAVCKGLASSIRALKDGAA